MAWKNIYEEEEEKQRKDAAASLAAAEPPAGFDDTAYRETKPVYTSQYADRIDGLLNRLENREDFSYDAERDPLYQQYRTQYRREGQRAAEDTLASAATHAGGMNSYAVTAAQQAGDYYNAKLMDVLPELAQLAYERYEADYDEDLDALKRLQDREAEDYDRYQDDLADWYAELEAAYQQYRDSVKDRQWQADFDYGKEQDALAYEKWREQMDYEASRDAEADRQWQEKLDYQKAQDALAYEKWLAQQVQKQPQVSQSQELPPKTQTQQPDSAAGTDHYQTAIRAALRGDRAAAEAALARREEKMTDPSYQGTGGGTSMAAARQYIESLLAASEGADISGEEASGLLDKAAWKERRAAGVGPEASYATYEDYVSDYLRYLTREA